MLRVIHAGKGEAKDWTTRYEALMAHYGMEPTKNNVTIAHENGDVEQSHHQFKRAVDQALRVRASRDFPNREAYERFLADLVRGRNLKRNALFVEEQKALQPLPTTALAPCQELRVTVSQFSTIHVKTNVYSVPSRLIGTSVLLRLKAETLEGYVGSTVAFTLPRLIGKQQHRIDYHHVIWSLVRKPGAFAAYRYRDDLFPTTTFRLAYDRLVEGGVERADRNYVRLLQAFGQHLGKRGRNGSCPVAGNMHIANLRCGAGSGPSTSLIRGTSPAHTRPGSLSL